MERLVRLLDVTQLVLGKALMFGLILLRATLMALYHILAGIFGWEKESKGYKRQHRTYPNHRKSHRSSDSNHSRTHSDHGDSKAKGDRFEDYIVKSLNPNYLKLKEWRGDKYVEGRYAESNMLPDLEIEYNHNSIASRFAIECKYRTSLIDDAVEIAKPYQLDNYSKFSAEKGMPVFIALGLGGYPYNPDEEFIIPLGSIKNNVIHYDELRQFKRTHQGNLFYDSRRQELR